MERRRQTSAASEPAASEPATSEPATSEPAASEPAASEPAASDSEDEAIGGGKAGEAEDILFSLDDLSQSQN